MKVSHGTQLHWVKVSNEACVSLDKSSLFNVTVPTQARQSLKFRQHTKNKLYPSSLIMADEIAKKSSTSVFRVEKCTTESIQGKLEEWLRQLPLGSSFLLTERVLKKNEDRTFAILDLVLTILKQRSEQGRPADQVYFQAHIPRSVAFKPLRICEKLKLNGHVR
jgi:hypothetical protein